MKGLNIIEPVPQIEQPLHDIKYQFRTRRTKVADKIEESSPEDLFQESESDFVPEEDDSDSEYEAQIKEPVGGRRRKVGEQIQESVTEHLFEDHDNDIDSKLVKLAELAEERANREDTESEDEPAIKRRKLDNQREKSVPHAASEDNDSNTDIVPRINIPSVFDVNIEPRRKRLKYKPKAYVGNEDSDSDDDFVVTKAK